MMLRLFRNIRQNKHKCTTFALWGLWIVAFCLLLPGQAAAMDGSEARKLMAGLELFPSFLAADQDIHTKQDPQGGLQLVILYNNDRRTAEKMAARLKQIGTIKSMPIHTIVAQSHTFKQLNLKPAGIFISQENINNLNTIVKYGEKHSIIIFSPFANDLKQGVTGSIAITARIRPQVNMNSLKISHLAIKPFFLRISTQYTQ